MNAHENSYYGCNLRALSSSVRRFHDGFMSETLWFQSWSSASYILHFGIKCFRRPPTSHLVDRCLSTSRLHVRSEPWQRSLHENKVPDKVRMRGTSDPRRVNLLTNVGVTSGCESSRVTCRHDENTTAVTHIHCWKAACRHVTSKINSYRKDVHGADGHVRFSWTKITWNSIGAEGAEGTFEDMCQSTDYTYVNIWSYHVWFQSSWEANW